MEIILIKSENFDEVMEAEAKEEAARKEARAAAAAAAAAEEETANGEAVTEEGDGEGAES